MASNLSLAIHFILTIVLSRLLAPDDVGVFSMSAVIIAIAHVFRDFGVTTFIKRVKVLDEMTIRTARTILTLTSTTVAILLYLSASAWANFFNETRVKEVVQVLAIGFLFIPLGAIASAIFTREVAIGKFAIATIASALLYFFSSVIMAMNDFKHMTMAWANIVNILSHGILLNIMLTRKLPWKPSLQGWRQMTVFGVGNVATNLTIAINNAFPDVALGRISTPTFVGLYSRANGTVTMIDKLLQRPIAYFTLPQMAKLHHEKGDVAGAMLNISSTIQCIIFPALAWIAFVAPTIIETLYGQKWVAAAAAVPPLCVAIGITTSFSLAAPTLTSIGKSYAPLFPLLVSLGGKLIAIATLYDGTLWSFSIAILIGEAISIPVYIWILHKYIGLSVRNWTTLNVKQLIWLAPTNAIVLVFCINISSVLPASIYLGTTAIFSMAIHLALFSRINLPIRNELFILLKNLKFKESKQ